MLGVRKWIRCDRYDYTLQAYGGKKRNVIESFYFYGFVKQTGGRIYEGNALAMRSQCEVSAYYHDVKSVSINDSITIDNLVYKVNAITQNSRNMITLTCNADAK